MGTDYWHDGYIIRRQLVPQEMIDDFNPRLDIRLIRGQDPHHYAHNLVTSS